MEGNQMKMREALLKLRSEIGRFCYNDWIPYDVWQECDDVISHALSSPPRNCDVGTAEEQAKRFHAFCDGHSSGIGGMCDGNCPCFGCVDGCHCLCKWSQMPYEAEEGGER